MQSGAIWTRIRARRWAYTFSILATLSLGILIGTVISYGVKGKEGQKSDATPLAMPSSSQTAAGFSQQLSNAFSQVAKQLEPSVVNINTESTIKNVRRRRGGQGGGDDEEQDPNGGGGGGGMDDFFNRFLGGQGGADAGPIRERSLGSGVIVDSKGFIVTNRHVVDKADRIRVRIED